MLPPLNSRTKSHLTHNKRKSSKNKAGRFKIEFRNGRFVIPSADAWHIHWQEPYYLLLTIPWSGFFLFMVLSYMIVNTAFAIAYLMGGDCIANATPGAFGDVFFFSVQTISSIGYGSMYPTSVYANTVVTIEALTGGMGVALMTGLAFTKFSQPTARVIFSNVATISNYNGIPTLMFRAANQRRNQIIEAQMSAYLMQDEVSVEGEYMRRFY
ncbi:MAG: ion channel, partial [Cyanobacteria bacterium J06558_2]